MTLPRFIREDKRRGFRLSCLHVRKVCAIFAGENLSGAYGFDHLALLQPPGISDGVLF